MRIGLIDVDGHRWPNLCLMKLSAYHNGRGDTVEWHRESRRYDLVYMSRVFTDSYSKDFTGIIHADRIVRGGTGYDLDNRLPEEVEHTCPDYALYPQFADTAYGFLSRGCPRGCGFCIVGKKEGLRSVAVADLSEFWRGQKEIKLLDANLLACPDWERLLAQLADSQATVDFTQGLDIRLVTPEKAALLNRVKTKMLHFAWDNPEDDLTPYFRRFAEMTAVKDCRKRRVYVLTNYGSSHEQDLYRIYTLRDMGYDPYVMIYEKATAPPITRQLQRWVNNKRLFWAIGDFNDYDPDWRKQGAPAAGSSGKENRKRRIYDLNSSNKLQKVLTEISRTKEKIAAQQTRLRKLEQQKTELENVEIVGMVRGLSVAPEELAAFIKAFRGSKAGAPVFMEREGNENDGLEQKTE